MKRSALDIVLMVFRILIFIAITFALIFYLVKMPKLLNAEYEGWEGLGAGIGIAVVFIIFLGAILCLFLIALIGLFVSVGNKNYFLKKIDKEQQGYEKCLKIKKNNILHFGLLMAYAVLVLAIFIIVMNI